MKKWIPFFILTVIGLNLYAMDEESAIIQIIKDSREGYTGECPCPYDKDQQGKLCGPKAVYFHPGVYDILCYRGDITSEMVRQRVLSNP